MTKKVLITFSTLNKEMDFIEKEAREVYYIPLALFGHEIKNEGDNILPAEGESQIFIAKLLPLLIQLIDFLDHIEKTVKMVIHQLALLYSENQSFFHSQWKYIHANQVFEKLGNVLAVCITFDEIIAENTLIDYCWESFKKASSLAKFDPSQFGINEDTMNDFSGFVGEIQARILDGKILSGLCRRMDFLREFIPNTNTKKSGREGLANEYRNYMDHGLRMLEAFGTTGNSTAQGRLVIQMQEDVGKRVVALSGLYTVFREIFHSDNKKIFRRIWGLQEMFPTIALCGNVVFTFDTFFGRQDLHAVVAEVSGRGLEAAQETRIKQVRLMDGSFESQVQKKYLDFCKWLVEIERAEDAEKTEKALSNFVNVLVHGVRLAFDISELLKKMLLMHSKTEVSMQRRTLSYASRCSEMLVALRFTLHRRSAGIAERMPLALQMLAARFKKMLETVDVKVRDDKQADNVVLDNMYLVLVIMMHTINAVPSEDRVFVGENCLDFLAIEKVSLVQEKQYYKYLRHLRTAELLLNYSERIARLTDCGWMFWNRDMLEYYLEDIYKDPTQAHRLQFVMTVFEDIGRMLRKNIHYTGFIHGTSPQPPEDSDNPLFLSFCKDTLGIFDRVITRNLKDDIDKDLRFHAHAHLDVKERNPLKDKGEIKDLIHFIKLRPIKFFQHSIDLALQVTQFLDEMFYNLSTLHNFTQYDQMRNIAWQKYGLKMKEVYLPTVVKEQELDVLEIMRNIHVFVAKYNYNLNNQMFVQRTTEEKHLKVIGIAHISNSIRSHGTGIMNTAVNVTFQFLKEKFKIFSGFLYDDYIKSLATRDLRGFNENRAKNTKIRYEFSWAENFIIDIKRLQVSNTRENYLDKFRVLLTEIGNALGYVRMIRSGGLHFISNAAKFIPDITETVLFGQGADEDHLSPQTVDAGNNLDSVIKNISHFLGEGSDYFRELVKTFAKPFRDPKNRHLKNFFIVIPPVMLNFIEHIIISKEKITKRAVDASFCDDGFALGIAFILRVLGQDDDYDSLRWYSAVSSHYREEYRKVEEELANKKNKKKAQTLNFRLNQLKTLLLEFKLLDYSLNSARIFFVNCDDL
eukprot:Anaeramoba_ignava/a479362_86.p1 GENE.a479362_86~~a479362_86.p1  ORF type:complete len:1184 (-),score=304.20 a479362_86:2743-5994(-)